jgi:hypothetical protein
LHAKQLERRSFGTFNTEEGLTAQFEAYLLAANAMSLVDAKGAWVIYQDTSCVSTLIIH